MKDKLKQLGGLFITFAVVGVTTFGRTPSKSSP